MCCTIGGPILRVPREEASSWLSCPLRTVLANCTDRSMQGSASSCLMHGLSAGSVQG